jgi:cytochrome oxidase assembly protein ShyY1
LSQPAQDITPLNSGKFPWSKAKINEEEFENEYSMKKVKVKGIFNHDKEILVTKMRNGEKGVDIVTPFFTHLNEKGEECGVLVNRGWVPWDLRDLRLHYT